MRVLLIEDDRQMADYLRKALGEVGAVADHAADGREGLLQAASGDYDALVIDRMLPGMDGLAIIRTLRASGNLTPVLILSALGEVDDRVEGLRAGGDDYLVKPFAFSELHARLEALLRRGTADAPETRLRVADLEMDLLKREVTRAGHPIALQPREFRLLEYLMRSAGRVCTRLMILEHVWEYTFDPGSNVVDVYIRKLREKIDAAGEAKLLHSVRGAGYTIRELK